MGGGGGTVDMGVMSICKTIPASPPPLRLLFSSSSLLLLLLLLLQLLLLDIENEVL